MPNVRQAAALAFAGVFVGAPASALAQQVHPGETQGLGLTGARTPTLLKEVAADPYRAPAEPACQSIPAELVALNQVLGADADQPQPKKSMVSKAEKAVAGAVRGMIPYRDEVRFLTQADKKDHQLMDATRAAWARRGFLRGLEANLHCGAPQGGEIDTSNAEPLAPAPDTRVAQLDLPAAAAAEPDVLTPATVQASAPGEPWQLPPPGAAEGPQAAYGAPAAGPQPVLATVMLRDAEPEDYDRPGR